MANIILLVTCANGIFVVVKICLQNGVQYPCFGELSVDATALFTGCAVIDDDFLTIKSIQ